MDIPAMPLRILALAPLLGTEGGNISTEPVWISEGDIDSALGQIAPSLTIPLPKSLCPAGEIGFRPRSIKDFKPDGLIKIVPYLNNVWKARVFALDAKTQNMGHNAILSKLRQWPDLPILDFPLPPSSARRVEEKSKVDDILKMVALPDENSRGPSETAGLVETLDGLLRSLFKAIYGDKEFRALESVWRGLELLCKAARPVEGMEIGIVPVTYEGLEDTLEGLVFRLATDLPSVILLDIPFDTSARSTELLEALAGFAESLLTPVVTWIGPSFFNLQTWSDLDKLPYITHYLEEPHFGKWRALCEKPASQWVSLTCLRFLVRFPYGPANPTKPVVFDEGQYLWISPVWGIGSLLAGSQKEFGWPTRFTDWQRVFVPDLALYEIGSNSSIPLETSLGEDRLRQFVKANLMPLVCAINRDMVFCPFEKTINGGSLAYQLFLSRITQLLLWCKDNFPSGLEAEQIRQGIESVFSLFWEKTGYQISNRLNVSVYKPDAETQGQVKIVLEPPKELLSSRENVVMEIPW